MYWMHAAIPPMHLQTLRRRPSPSAFLIHEVKRNLRRKPQAFKPKKAEVKNASPSVHFWMKQTQGSTHAGKVWHTSWSLFFETERPITKDLNLPFFQVRRTRHP
jgi:hypothetical protein